MLNIKSLPGVLFTLICFYGSSQPALSVQKFEYIWKHYDVGSKSRVIVLSDDSIKQRVEKSFEDAFLRRWNIVMPGNNLDVKPLAFFNISDTPRFNTRIKKREPGTWYLFLQIFDKGNPLLNYNDDSLTTTLKLKCRLINGDDASTMLDKDLSVKLLKEQPRPGQVVLTRLPAYPSYFIKVFDSIANWLFQPGSADERSVWLKPACVYEPANVPEVQIKELLFRSDYSTIQSLNDPAFTFKMPGPQHAQIRAYKNEMGNMANGALMLFTGVNIDKARAFEYNADFTFEEHANIYHCILTYFEKEIARRERETDKNSDGTRTHTIKSGQYQLDERRVSPDTLNIIKLNNDTIATFLIKYTNNVNAHKSYTLFWDGGDSNTITTLPKEWNNKSEDDNVIISGRIGNDAFLLKTLNETAIKELYLNEQLVMIMYGKPYPGKALLLQPISEEQLKIFTILSSVPYAYFNYSADSD